MHFSFFPLKIVCTWYACGILRNVIDSYNVVLMSITVIVAVTVDSSVNRVSFLLVFLVVNRFLPCDAL